MKTVTLVYNSHDNAIEAVNILNDNKYDMSNVSVMGGADVVGEHVHIKSTEPAKDAPVLVGTGAGLLVGVLSGIGVFAIPGFGFLYGAGAVVGAVAGFDFGLVTGGMASLLATLGVDKEHVVKLHEHLKKGKFLVILKGSEEELKRAEEILFEEGPEYEIHK